MFFAYFSIYVFAYFSIYVLLISVSMILFLFQYLCFFAFFSIYVFCLFLYL